MSASFPNMDLGQMKVLVVDDHPVNREFLRAGLSAIVGQLDLADSGEAAIQRCRTETYHVILMDLHMPQLDGLATANRIRDLDGPSARARMVVMTADARPEERSRLLDGGFDAYLSKPLSILQLTSALHQLMDPAGAREFTPEQQQRHAGSEALLDVQRALTAAHGDAGLASRLGRMLSQELDEKLPLLDQWVIEGHTDKAAELLHQWTGAGGFAGAMRFSRACGDLRRRLQDTAASSTGTAYTDFLRIARATSQALMSAPSGRTAD